jgi:hypothetical protein
VILESCLSSRQGTNAKQKGRIYEGLLKVHEDKENADIIKNQVDRCIPHAPFNLSITLNWH